MTDFVWTDLENAVPGQPESGSTAVVEPLNAMGHEVERLETDKQDTLVSGTNIKTINNISILGNGNIEVGGGSGDVSTITLAGDTDVTLQPSSGDIEIATEGTYNASTNPLVTMGVVDKKQNIMQYTRTSDVTNPTDGQIIQIDNGSFYKYYDSDDAWVLVSMSYINATSGLSATDINAAIDELASEKVDIIRNCNEDDIDNLYPAGSQTLIYEITHTTSAPIEGYWVISRSVLGDPSEQIRIKNGISYRIYNNELLVWGSWQSNVESISYKSKDTMVNTLHPDTSGDVMLPVGNGSTYGGTRGLVTSATGSGLRLDGDVMLDGGCLWVATTSNNAIETRTKVGAVLPVILTNDKIDYIVKRAMTDGVGAAWTDAERLAALLRMGCTVDENGFVKWTATPPSE